MAKLYNEVGISLVLGSGNWIGISHEIEYKDGTEVRKYGWKKSEFKYFVGVYFRLWIHKTVFIISSDGLSLVYKDKIGLKVIFGAEYKIN